jgi:ribosome maturation factor RimP
MSLEGKVGGAVDRHSEDRMYRDIPDNLRSLIEPIVEERGCELVDVEIRRAAGEGLLRLVIDSKTGDGRVPISTCEEVSREVEAQVDAADWMPGRYRLEVSSPGLDRVLAREKDFVAARGMQVKIQTRRPVGTRRRFKGVLVDFIDGVARVDVDGDELEIPFEEVEKANSLYQFSRDDFAGKDSGTASR